MTPSVGHNPQRRSALRRLDLLDAPSEESFDRLTRMATSLLESQAAFVVLVDGDRDFYLSQAGFPDHLAAARETAGDSPARHVVADESPLTLRDIRTDGRFADTAIVGALDATAFAGVPLALADGTVAGALCVVDDRPRDWVARDVAVLSEMASSLVAEMELRGVRRTADADRRRHENVIRDLEVIVWEMEAGSGRVTFVEGDLQGVLGASAEEWRSAPGFWLNRVVHPRDRDRVLQQFRKAADERVPADLEYRVITGDGSTLHVLNRLRVVDGVGGTTLLRGIVMDRTGQRQAERALRESESRFRLMVEGSEQVIFYEHDRHGRFVYVSPSVRDVLGYEPRELLGRSYRTLLSGDPTDEDVHLRTGQALESGIRSEPYTAVLSTAHGREVVVEIIERPLMRDGDVVGLQGFARDITRRKEAEQKLAESEELFRQAQKMEAVGRLAGGVAHDFNNILTAIKGHVDLVLKDPATAARVREDIQEVARSADRAVSLTRQLLAFSRQQVMRPRVLDLNSVVGDLDPMLRRLIGEDILLETQLQPRVSCIRADPGQLQQVLMNLVVNARDALPSGGQIRLRTTDATISQAEADRFPYPVRPGPYVLLTVSDTGHGMDADTLKRVFEPFFTTKPAGKGTGLGLSTVYGIIKQSGGYIWANSEPGDGTTFRVYLPRVEEEALEGTGDGSPVEDAGRRGDPVSGTVLVVEDEPSVRHLICKTLERRGYAVMEAENGTAALKVLDVHARDIDLVLTDVVMPDMGGAELGRAIRDSRPRARVLYMSGYTEDEIVLDRGGILRSEVAFLPKPFSSDDLLSAVADALEPRLA